FKKTVVTYATVLAMVVFLFLIPNRHHRMAAFPLGLALPLFVLRSPTPLILIVQLINLGGASLYLIKALLLRSPVFLWNSWSTALCLLILGLAGVICFSFDQESWKRLPARLAILASAAVLLIATLLPSYEARRFAAWQTHWSNQRARAKGLKIQSDRADWANCWSCSAELTRGGRSVVAYSGSNLPYPLRGNSLRNEILSIPIADCGDPYFDWGHDCFKPSSETDSTRWLQRIRDHGVDVLCVFREETRPWPREMDWALEDRADFELRWQAEHAAIFSVRHVEQEPSQASLLP
ncbi:MAG TPA: hypothetical protein VFR10_12615, partial [bacterium]|nr:hypothetical protein [bacterium]